MDGGLDWRLIEECNKGSLESLLELEALFKRRGLDNFERFVGELITRARLSLHEPLRKACEEGVLWKAKELIEQGASPYYDSLIIACRKGHLEIVKLFDEAGADLEGDVAATLWAAAEHGHLEIVRFLLEKGVKSSTALYRALGGSHLEVLKLLFEKGAATGPSYFNMEDFVISAERLGHSGIIAYLESDEIKPFLP